MMRIVVASVAVVVFSSSLGCIGNRDNPLDPAIVPRPRIQITVAGEPTSIGARRSNWILDGSTSSDPDDSIKSYSWSLSTGPTADIENESDWVEFSTSESVEAPTDTSFIDELVRIVDFDPAPGLQPNGTVERVVRLVVKDHDGHDSATSAPIVVYNTPPTVSLGADRRIVPGGQWWNVTADVNGDGATDVLDGVPHFVTVYADIQDADPGESAGIGPDNIRWRVTGLLAEQLDTDIDGFIDPGTFTDPQRRKVTFRAPLFPSRSRISVEVSDAIDLTGGEPGTLISPTSSIVAIDVGTTRWVGDTGTSTIARIETSTFRSPGETAAIHSFTVAAARGLILAFSSPGSFGRIETLSQSLSPTCGGCYLDLTRTVNTSDIHATGDGAGGWWVLDGQFGELHHVGPDLTNPGTVTFSDLEGTAASDLVGAEAIAAIPGSTDVWVAGGSTAGEKLYRISTAGLVSTIPLGASFAQIAIDPQGGGWLFTVDNTVPQPFTAELVHFDDAGTLGPPEDLTPLLPQSAVRPSAISFDFRGNVLWGTYGSSGGKCLFRRDGGGLASLEVKCGIGLIGNADIHADPLDGTAIAATFEGFFNSISRFGPTLDVVGTIPLGDNQGVQYGLYVMEGGTVVTDLFDTGAGLYYRRWIEAAIEVGAHPSRYVEGIAAGTMAVDPLSGAVWVWDETCDCLTEIVPQGTPNRTIDLGVPGVISGFPAFDFEERRLWIAWNGVGGTGLSYVDLTDDPADELSPVTTSFTGPTTVYDIDVVPGGQVCLSGSIASDTAPIALGWVYRPETATAPSETVTVETTDASPLVSVASADTLFKGCYFLPKTTSLAHAAYLGPTGQVPTTPTNELNAPGGEKRSFVGGAKDYFTNSNPTRFWVLNEQSQAGFPTRVFTIYDFTINTTTTIGGPSFSLGEAGPIDEAVSLDFDPYYRHFYVGIGDPLSSASVPGRVLRIDAYLTFREIDRYEGFFGPVVAGTP